MRYINLYITNEYIKGVGEVVGAAGSHDDVAFRMTFGDMWEGLTKTIVWRNAYRENPVYTLVTAAMLEDVTVPNVYIVPIPAEPKEFVGKMGMTIFGADVEAGVETQATFSVYGEFVVMDSYWPYGAREVEDVTPSQAVQLQSQIEKLTDSMLEAIQKSNTLQEQWDNLEVEAETLAPGDDATVEKEETASSVKFTFGIPRGRDGVATTSDGVFAFNVNEQGHLILSYVADEDLDFSIGDDGHLYVSLDV